VVTRPTSSGIAGQLTQPLDGAVQLALVEVEALHQRLGMRPGGHVGGGPAHVLGVGRQHRLPDGRTLQRRRQIREQPPALIAGQRRQRFAAARVATMISRRSIWKSEILQCPASPIRV
jgi:hypothetical protein